MPKRRFDQRIARARALVAVLGAAVVVAVLATGAHAASPDNDGFAAAQGLTGESGSVSASNVDATREADEPRNGPGEASVWYRWTAPASGRAVFDTCEGGTFDTLLAVYVGDSLGTLRQLGANDDACGLRSMVALTVSAGSVYYVAVDGYEEVGSFTLRWRLTRPQGPPPANDAFAAARPVVGIRGRLQSTNADASGEAGEPPFLQSTSVWFRWRAPRTMPVVFSVCRASFDQVLAVVGGREPGSTTVLATTRACGLDRGAKLLARRGVVYRIAVAGVRADAGRFELRWEPGTCSVPSLRGLTLARVKQVLPRSGCSLGAVRNVASPVVPRGLVITQWPDPGRRLRPLAPVRIAVSRGESTTTRR
jgi:hypothetical protein